MPYNLIIGRNMQHCVPKVKYLTVLVHVNWYKLSINSSSWKLVRNCEEWYFFLRGWGMPLNSQCKPLNFSCELLDNSLNCCREKIRLWWISLNAPETLVFNRIWGQKLQCKNYPLSVPKIISNAIKRLKITYTWLHSSLAKLWKCFMMNLVQFVLILLFLNSFNSSLYLKSFWKYEIFVFAGWNRCQTELLLPSYPSEIVVPDTFWDKKLKRRTLKG